MVEMDKVRKLQLDYEKLPDEELVGYMHQWVEHSEMHVAAKLVLATRKERQETKRFHLVFWPSLIAAIAAVIALFMMGTSNS